MAFGAKKVRRFLVKQNFLIMLFMTLNYFEALAILSRPISRHFERLTLLLIVFQHSWGLVSRFCLHSFCDLRQYLPFFFFNFHHSLTRQMKMYLHLRALTNLDRITETISFLPSLSPNWSIYRCIVEFFTLSESM